VLEGQMVRKDQFLNFITFGWYMTDEEKQEVENDIKRLEMLWKLQEDCIEKICRSLRSGLE